MLVFIDESGDTGLRLEQGSSRYFAVSLVAFDDSGDATACDQRIQLLKRELGWVGETEFHFKRNSNRVRQAFLRAVAPYNFFYYGIVVDKDPGKFWSEGFKNKAAFYKYVCGLVFENARHRLHDAIVVIDRSGEQDFQRQLASYLREKMERDPGVRILKQVKMQRSESNNLLQLADYVASIICRSVHNDQQDGDEFRRVIAHREISVQVLPK
ncbi:MAG: DUF3800 domain-containing protein [Candidatus Uhrbacteria bacterium]